MLPINSIFFLLCLVCTAASSPYQQLWLNYTRVSSPYLSALAINSLSCALPGPLCGELRVGLTGLGFLSGSGGHALAVVLPAGAPIVPAWPPSPSLEGYNISVGEDRTITLQSASLQGALYGAWRLLALLQREAPSLLTVGVAEASLPSSPLRTWNLWDNLDGSMERGYSGRSILYPLGSADPARVTDFARLLGSMGLNAIVLDNVNACGSGNQEILSSPNLALLAPIAATFYAYGIHSLLVPCWTSPETVGGLNTSDPRSAAVTAWWTAKIAEVRGAFPSGAFRGLLFKGDTEGQPGPGTYNQTELFGANYFGGLLGEVDAIVVWRAFSHPPGGSDMPLDQALFQYKRFEGWDGETLPNVVLQTKNGPYDFQVREPVHSLFSLPHLNFILEVEATPEYLGQDIHAIALPVQWASYLAFDLCGGCSGAGNTDTTLGGVVSRGVYSGMAAVSNFGADVGWSSHALNAVNALGFGRLAWAPSQPPLGVIQEWVELTFPGSAPSAISGLVGLLGDTWEAYENFTASLGWGFVCDSSHYGMSPATRRDYTNATKTTVGYSRGTGGYAATYRGQAQRNFSSLDTCPEELLLAFYTVPYSHVLKGARYGGLTVLQWIYSSHAAGAATSAGFVERWGGVLSEGLIIDPAVFAGVSTLLDRAAKDAAVFSNTVVGYFANLTGVPPLLS